MDTGSKVTLLSDMLVRNVRMCKNYGQNVWQFTTEK